MRPAAIDMLDSGVVYRNPVPHLRAVHAMHPTITRLKDGSLVCAYDLGQGPESFDYSTCLSKSGDNGENWSRPSPLFTSPFSHGGRRCNYLVRIRALSDGSVFGLGARIYRDRDDEGFVNRANLGYAPMDLIAIRSADAGATWSPPRTIKPPIVGPSFEICHPVVELTDGRLLAPMGTWKGWNGEAPNGMKAVALVSTDAGTTWPTHLDVMDDYANGVIHFEQSLTPLPDGRLLAVAWAYNEQTGKSLPTPYALSDAHATRFNPPMLTGLNGQTAKITCLADGRILCLYRRDDQPGLWANLSRIEGGQWINLSERPIWQGAASGMTGAQAGAEELSGLKFGSPNLLTLANGEVFAVFWCVEDCLSVIRWVRIRVA